VYSGISMHLLLGEFTMKFINENVYSNERIEISILFNRLLHDFIV
jgi:hypothetical protein